MKERQNIKVLLVEDDKDDYFLFKHSLNEIRNNSYELTWAATYEAAFEFIKKKEHDIYFFDYRLGAKNGLDLIRESMEEGVDAPIIILTGLRNQQTDLEAMELGALDYLVKGEINGEKLERSIRYCIEHHMMVKKLRTSEIKFRSIFEDSHDVIFLSKRNGQILEINKAAERLFGFTLGELLKMNAFELYSNKSDRERFISEIETTGNCANFEVTLVDRSGDKKFCTITANIQTDESGQVYYQGIIHDMTMRKKAEHDMMIAEKLTIAGKIARTLAHEVRNPLTNINLSTEQLEEYVEDKNFRPYFEIIKRNSKRINDLVTELLENSKPMELKESVIPVSVIFRNTLDLARDRSKLKNIKIETDLQFNGEAILADEPKLTIAILNILMNAIEAVEANTGIIKVSGTCEGKRCFISIEDNGCGIASEHLGKVFEPYFTSKSNGMGLGLSTSQNIIHTHKGIIEVETELNKGTKFKIELDLA